MRSLIQVNNVFYHVRLSVFLVLLIVITQVNATCKESVKAITPLADFIVHDEGTATHISSGLMWKVCSEGLSWIEGTCTGAISRFSWDQALMQPKTQNSNGGEFGYSDWRLPNIRELSSIVEFKCIQPAVNSVIFPGLSRNSSVNWSSTPFNDDKAWYVDFSRGDVNVITRTGNLPVRLVRSISNENEATDLSNGLVAHYEFEGDVSDSSGNSNDGMANNITFATGVKGQSIVFDGVNNPGHVQIYNSDSLVFSDEATFTGWLKVTDFIAMDGYGRKMYSNGGGSFIAKSHDRRGFALKYHLRKDDGFVSAYLATYASWKRNGKIISEFNGELDEWVFVTLTLSAVSGSRVYLNNNLYSEYPLPVDFQGMNSQDLYIGKFSDSWYPFKGEIDELRVYNRVLSESEIKEIYELVL